MPATATRIDDGIIPLVATDNEGILQQVDNEEPIMPLTEENEEELIQIDDEEVPLAVVDDEEEAGEELVEIEDEEVALASGAAVQEVWWSWIPFIGAAASIADGYRRSRKNKKESGDGKKKE